MHPRILAAAAALLLAGCANFPIPTSTTDPPPAGAAVDSSCMQDCLADNAHEEFCRQRCAK